MTFGLESSNMVAVDSERIEARHGPAVQESPISLNNQGTSTAECVEGLGVSNEPSRVGTPMLNFIKEPCALGDQEQELRRLEEANNFSIRFMKCIETDKLRIVAASSKVNVKREYEFKDVDRIVQDFAEFGHLLDHSAVSKMIRLVLSDASSFTLSSFHAHIGWHTYKNELIFMYDRIASSIPIKSKYTGNLNLNSCGDLETYVHGIRELVVPQKKLLTVFIAGASGIINQALDLSGSYMSDECNIMLCLYGESGSGKTTAEQLALSFWGNYSASQISTVNKTQHILSERGIIPVTVDDILSNDNHSSGRAKNAAVCNQIFAFSTGASKGRMNQKSVRYYGAVLISSEASLFERLADSNADGQFYRMIEMNCVKGELTKDHGHAKALKRLVRRNYGLGAFALGEYMVKHGYVGDKLIGMYEDQLEDLEDDARLGEYSRAANRLALIMVTAILIDKCFHLNIDINDVKEVLIECVVDAFKVKESISEVKQYASDYMSFYDPKYVYEDIRNLINNNPEKFASSEANYDEAKHLGIYQQNSTGEYQLLITRKHLEAIVHRMPLEQILTLTQDNLVTPYDQRTMAILRKWRDRGWLYCRNKDQRLHRRLRLSGNKKQTDIYHIIFK